MIHPDDLCAHLRAIKACGGRGDEAGCFDDGEAGEKIVHALERIPELSPRDGSLPSLTRDGQPFLVPSIMQA
jgi:hypothetical protein